MQSKELTKSVLSLIENHDFMIIYDFHSDCVISQTRFGAIMLEFYVDYKKEISSYVSATYENPEEAHTEFVPFDISEINIYINSKVQDLENNDLEKLYDKLLEKIL